MLTDGVFGVGGEVGGLGAAPLGEGGGPGGGRALVGGGEGREEEEDEEEERGSHGSLPGARPCASVEWSRSGVGGKSVKRRRCAMHGCCCSSALALT